MATAFDNQIQNRNFLTPVGFKFTLAKEPKVSFFCNSARIPEITLGNSVQPSYLKDIDIPGEKLTYGDFSLRFLVDENLENYMKMHNWLTGLGFPETTQQFKTLTTDEISGEGALDQQFSDASLHILNSNFRDVAIVKFKDLFPVSLSSLEFDASDTDINYFTADVTFKYTIYDILAPDGRTPL
jgi:hypothetical protein|tara:strand:+ start:243 stop:794 length:552 start_codon:yes stop_codon:yes gene_type:complete